MHDELQTKVAADVITEVFKRAMDGLESLVQFFGEQSKKFDPLGQIAAAYARSMRDRYDLVHIFGMSRPMPMTQIYIRVRFLPEISAYRRRTLAQLDSEGLNQLESASARETSDAIDAVREHARVVLLGEPGSGKTTFLKHLVLCALSDQLDDQRVPVFVTLKELTDGESDLRGCIAHEFEVAGVAHPEPFVTRLLEQGRCIILLDGLDEIGTNHLGIVAREIMALSNTYKNNKFVVTCRVAAYNILLEGFAAFEIAKFTKQDIASFCFKWFAHQPRLGHGFLTELARLQSIHELATTPLLLTMLCVTYEEGQRLPANRAEMYREAIEAMLKKWDATRLVVRDEPYRQLSTKRKEDLFAHIAAKTFPHQQYFIKEPDLHEIIAEYLETLPGMSEIAPLDAATAILQAIEAHHGLLVERARGIHSFSHLSIQEYFVAAFVHSLGLEAQRRLAILYVGDVRWREVIILVACLLQDANDFVIALIEGLVEKGAPHKYIENLQRERETMLDARESHFLSPPRPFRLVREIYTGPGSSTFATAGKRAVGIAEARAHVSDLRRRAMPALWDRLAEVTIHAARSLLAPTEVARLLEWDPESVGLTPISADKIKNMSLQDAIFHPNETLAAQTESLPSLLKFIDKRNEAMIPPPNLLLSLHWWLRPKIVLLFGSLLFPGKQAILESILAEPQNPSHAPLYTYIYLCLSQTADQASVLPRLIRAACRRQATFEALEEEVAAQLAESVASELLASLLPETTRQDRQEPPIPNHRVILAVINAIERMDAPEVPRTEIIAKILKLTDVNDVGGRAIVRETVETMEKLGFTEKTNKMDRLKLRKHLSDAYRRARAAQVIADADISTPLDDYNNIALHFREYVGYLAPVGVHLDAPTSAWKDACSKDDLLWNNDWMSRLTSFDEMNPNKDRMAQLAPMLVASFARNFEPILEDALIRYTHNELLDVVVASEAILDVLGSEIRIQREIRDAAVLTLLNTQIRGQLLIRRPEDEEPPPLTA